MDDQKNSSVKPEKKKNSKSWIIVVVILAILLLLLGWQYFSTRKTMNTLLEEKEKQRVELKSELKELMTEYDSIKVEYGALTDSLDRKDSIIMANAEEIKDLLNYKWEYYKVKKKLTLLRKITQSYVHQMDSLITLNKQLEEEKEEITRNFQKEKQKTSELEKEKTQLIEKVEMASVLQAYNIQADPIQLRWGGRKEKVVDKARKVDKVRVCFTIGENDLVEPGTKSVYIRIARPDNEIIAQKKDDLYTFKHKGETLQYTIKKEINYQNEPVDLCLYWSKHSPDPAMEGEYNVAIFAGDEVIEEIGKTSFKLE